MLSLDSLAAHCAVQEELLAQQKLKPNTTNAGISTKLILCECGVPYKHECYAKDCTSYQGMMITLWAYLGWPETRARKHSLRVKMFKLVKVNAPRGMANGPSPLRKEVNFEEEESCRRMSTDSDDW